MNKTGQIMIFTLLLVMSSIAFILHIFVWEAPDGNLGLLLCIGETTLMLVSFIRLCQLSAKIKVWLLAWLEFLLSL